MLYNIIDSCGGSSLSDCHEFFEPLQIPPGTNPQGNATFVSPDLFSAKTLFQIEKCDKFI